MNLIFSFITLCYSRSSIVVNFLKNVTGKDAKDQTPRDFFEVRYEY